MLKVLKNLKRFFGEEVAATTVEYAVMLMLILGMCISAIQMVGGPVKAFWAKNQDQIENAVNQSN